MNTINELLDMIATEAISPHTHQCQSCGQTFSANEDGCPRCGANAQVTLIPKFGRKAEANEGGG